MTSGDVRPEQRLCLAWLLLLLDAGIEHGYLLGQQLQAQAGLNVELPVVYRKLHKLEQHGLARSRWEGSQSGPRRHSYQLTEEGHGRLTAIAEAIALVRDAHDTFVHAYERHATQER